MKLKNAIIAITTVVSTMTAFAEPTVTDVVAKQRYPWNGLVDITCRVTGINGTTNDLYFSVAAVMPDTGNARTVSLWGVMQGGTRLSNRNVYTNGYYHILWDASAELGQVSYDNMVMRVIIKTHNKVQLWEGGPYWADTNIGADNPEDYGYYFWWGDTVGYKGVNKWVASDGSSSNFSFGSVVPTYGKNDATLQSEGWVTSDGVLSPSHDAAHIHWGGDWRMPTMQEFSGLISNCAWTWTTLNGVNGYVVKGRGAYASASIFLPAAGSGSSVNLYNSGSAGVYWSSVPSVNYAPTISGVSQAWEMNFKEHDPGGLGDLHRGVGLPIRPVQRFTE